MDSFAFSVSRHVTRETNTIDCNATRDVQRPETGQQQLNSLTLALATPAQSNVPPRHATCSLSRISSLKTRTGALRRAPCHSLLTRRTRSPLAPAKLPELTSRGGSPPPKATSQAACLSPRRSLSIVERRRRRLRLPVVEEHRCEHERHALQEGARGPRAVEDRRNNAPARGEANGVGAGRQAGVRAASGREERGGPWVGRRGSEEGAAPACVRGVRGVRT